MWFVLPADDVDARPESVTVPATVRKVPMVAAVALSGKSSQVQVVKR